MRIGALVMGLGAALGPAAAVGTEALAFAAGRSTVPAVEAALGPLCHHDPARTLAVDGRLLPVCARCTGLWAGAAVGGVAGAVTPLRPRWIGRVAGGAVAATAFGLLAALAEAAGLLSTPNGVRVGLGLALGLAVPLVAALGGRLIARETATGRAPSRR